jgi:hypothetical protein
MASADPFNPPDPGPEPEDPGPRPVGLVWNDPAIGAWEQKRDALNVWVHAYRKAVLARARKELMAGAKPDAESVRAALIVLFSIELEGRDHALAEPLQALRSALG